MAKQDISKLKDWFKAGKYPTQEQFWDWMDSFIHKDDRLGIAANFPELDGVLQQKVDKEVFKYHFENQNNPHHVSKQQVGLGSVDNTADVDKPISTATKAVLDLKANKEHIHPANTLAGFDTDVTLAANSDEKMASQKAVKTYVDTINSTLQARIAKLEKSQLVVGMIMAWKGSINTIPAGWKLCEELKDKFILGAGNDFQMGATGGVRKHQLAEAEMPKHAHELYVQPFSVSGRGDTTYYSLVTPTRSDRDEVLSYKKQLSVGGNSPHENMPPYYALAYIEYVGHESPAA